MQEQFLDRILTCVDCHSEFIFTAGEQLFFFDKQFKNDPKRCKPCKSRRSGLAAAAHGAGPVPAGLSRTETRTQCSECGIETTVPFKPTQGRPVLCRQCFQLKNRATAPTVLSTPAQTITVASLAPSGAMLAPAAAIAAASSVVTASPQSSVATPAELAYVANLNAFHLNAANLETADLQAATLDALVHHDTMEHDDRNQDAPPTPAIAADSVPDAAQATARLTAELIASSPAELHAAASSTAELQTIAAEAPQA